MAGNGAERGTWCKTHASPEKCTHGQRVHHTQVCPRQPISTLFHSLAGCPPPACPMAVTASAALHPWQSDTFAKPDQGQAVERCEGLEQCIELPPQQRTKRESSPHTKIPVPPSQKHPHPTGPQVWIAFVFPKGGRVRLGRSAWTAVSQAFAQRPTCAEQLSQSHLRRAIRHGATGTEQLA